MSISRIIQVFVVQGGVGIYFLLLAMIILKRDRKRINRVISSFYISAALATIVNVIYAPLENEMVVTSLNFITYFLFCMANVFILIFVIICHKSEVVFTQKKSLTIIFIFGALLLGLAVIPNGIIINASTQWKPVWSLGFILYAILVTAFAVIPAIYLSIKIGANFKDQGLKKRWIFFQLGFVLYYIGLIGTSISNYLNDDQFRLIWSLASLVLFITSTISIYYGIGRQMRQK